MEFLRKAGSRKSKFKRIVGNIQLGTGLIAESFHLRTSSCRGNFILKQKNTIEWLHAYVGKFEKHVECLKKRKVEVLDKNDVKSN